MVRARPPKKLDDAAVNAFIEGADTPVDPRATLVAAESAAKPAAKPATKRTPKATAKPAAKRAPKATAKPAKDATGEARNVLVRNVPADLIEKIALIQEIDDRSQQRVALRALRIGVEAILDELDAG